jgi:hypothetical protein
VSNAELAQQVQTFLETAAYSLFDGQLHISNFRSRHDGQLTLAILHACVEELRSPTMQVNLFNAQRADLLAFFEYQLERHQQLRDEDFRHPNSS